MNKLTIIISFLNEQEEIRNTIANIRNTCGDEVDILLLDDASDDGYNYQEAARNFNARYVKQVTRCGIAKSRDHAIDLCRTEYFLLLDGHMRFRQKGWCSEIIFALQSDKRAIWCCQSSPIKKNSDDSISWNNNLPSFGAYMDFANYKWDLHWNYQDPNPNLHVVAIPIILGGAYACNKSYWKFLHGLEGLKIYGLDEQFISIKTWLEGGSCKLLKTVEVGHLYRTQFPYKIERWNMTYNRLLLSELLLPTDLKSSFFDKITEEHSLDICKKAARILIKNENSIIKQKKYYSKIFTNDISHFIQYNDFIKASNFK